MQILFIVALILLIPTYGLSLIIWFIIAFLKAKRKAGRVNVRKVNSVIIHPMFNGDFASFYKSLKLPYLTNITSAYAESCGRHIANYISQNENEASLFLRGIEIWRLKGSSQFPSAAESALYEKNGGALGLVHLVSFRAIDYISSANNLACFEHVNKSALKYEISVLELKLTS